MRVIMNVKELIKQLKKLPKSYKVAFLSEMEDE